MHRLAEIIGPAPSEIPPEEFEKRLREERDRVREEIAYSRTAWEKKTYTKKSGGTKKRNKKNLTPGEEGLRLLAEKGLSISDLEALLKGEESNG